MPVGRTTSSERAGDGPHIASSTPERGLRGDQKGSEGIRRDHKGSEGTRRDQKGPEGIRRDRRDQKGSEGTEGRPVHRGLCAREEGSEGTRRSQRRWRHQLPAWRRRVQPAAPSATPPLPSAAGYRARSAAGSHLVSTGAGEGERICEGRREGRWRPDATFDELRLPRMVAPVHGAKLRHRDVALVDDHEPIVRHVVDQRRRRLAWLAAREVAPAPKGRTGGVRGCGGSGLAAHEQCTSMPLQHEESEGIKRGRKESEGIRRKALTSSSPCRCSSPLERCPRGRTRCDSAASQPRSPGQRRRGKAREGVNKGVKEGARAGTWPLANSASTADAHSAAMSSSTRAFCSSWPTV